MVAVVATQELKAEDVLLRFKAEASHDKIHGKEVYYRTAGILLLVFAISYKVTTYTCG